MIRVTNVQVRRTEDSKVVGYASIELNNEFIIGGIKIIDGSKGWFISFPSYKTKEGEYKDLVYPLSKELRDYITQTVVETYLGLQFPQ